MYVFIGDNLTLNYLLNTGDIIVNKTEKIPAPMKKKRGKAMCDGE
jgi:hypothetical protein